MKNRISIIPLIISILTIITISIGTSYSLWTTSVQQQSENVIDVGCFRIVFDDSNIVGGGNISLSNAYPISNESGKKLVPYKFNISNQCSVAASYSVNVETLTSSTMDENVLDVYFNDEVIKHYISNTNNNMSEDAKSTMNIYNGYLGPSEEITYSLRVWIDYDVDVDTPNVQGKTWEGRVSVFSQPTFDKPVFKNKVIDQDNVTLEIETNNNKTVKTLSCYYGDKNSLLLEGTAVNNNKCQYPISAEYAKYSVVYTDNTTDNSIVKKLADYYIKDGVMIRPFDKTDNAKVTMEDGYVNMIVDNGGRGGLRTSNSYDFSEYGFAFIDTSYSSIRDSIYPSYSLSIAANGGSTIDKNDADGSFSINMTKNGASGISRTGFARSMYLDDSYKLTKLEILRNHSGNSVLDANIYNVWFQLKD